MTPPSTMVCLKVWASRSSSPEQASVFAHRQAVPGARPSAHPSLPILEAGPHGCVEFSPLTYTIVRVTYPPSTRRLSLCNRRVSSLVCTLYCSPISSQLSATRGNTVQHCLAICLFCTGEAGALCHTWNRRNATRDRQMRSHQADIHVTKTSVSSLVVCLTQTEISDSSLKLQDQIYLL